MKITNKSELFKAEGTIWQLAAKYACIQDSEFRSFC